jgi:hypothetical protein
VVLDGVMSLLDEMSSNLNGMLRKAVRACTYHQNKFGNPEPMAVICPWLYSSIKGRAGEGWRSFIYFKTAGFEISHLDFFVHDPLLHNQLFVE